MAWFFIDDGVTKSENKGYFSGPARADANDAATKSVLATGRRVELYEMVLIGAFEPIDEPVRFVPAGAPYQEVSGYERLVSPLTGQETFIPASSEPTARETTMPPVIVEEKPASLKESVTMDPPRPRGRPRKAGLPEPERAEPKATIDDFDPFAELLSDPKSMIVTVDPEAGTIAAGEWACPNCKKICFASQKQCGCGQLRPGQQLSPGPNSGDILKHRVGWSDTQCPRCGADSVIALAGEAGKVRICSNSECFGSEQAQKSYDMLYTALKGLEAGAPASAAPPSGTEPPSANPGPAHHGSTREGYDPYADEDGPTIPSEATVSTQTVYLTMLIDNPPAGWQTEPITMDGGEGGGGQMKALNTLLSDTGYGDGLRHAAVLAILGQVRALESLKELTKAEAHICITWLSEAGPVQLQALARALGPRKGSVSI